MTQAARQHNPPTFHIRVERNPNSVMGLGKYTIFFQRQELTSFPCLTGSEERNPFAYSGLTPPIAWKMIEPIQERKHPHQKRGLQEMARIIPAEAADAQLFSHTLGTRTFGTHGDTDYPFMIHTNPKQIGSSTGCIVPYERWEYARDLTNTAFHHANDNGYPLWIEVWDTESNAQYTPVQADAMQHRVMLVLDRVVQPQHFDVSTSTTDQLQQALQALQAEKDRLSAFLDNAGDGFFIHDMEGRILDANREACAMLGYQREELLQIYVSDMDPSINLRNLGGFWKRIKPGQSFTLESTNIRKDGSRFPVEVRGGLFGPPDNLLMLAMIRDIRERKRAEIARQHLLEALQAARDEAVRANQFKSSFLASMSHELRTPLNAIIGYAELLQEQLAESGDQASVDDLQKIHQSGHRLLSLINDILDLSKVEAGKMELSIQTLDLQEFLQELCVLVQPQFDKSNNLLHIDCPPDLQEIWADKNRLNQCIVNLLSNANKFTNQGDIRLIVRKHQDETGTWQEFAVQDTGIGIPADRLDELFLPFSQLGSDNRETLGGTGLGLAISQQLCRLMGGDISAQSTEGKGSTFRIRIPAEAPDRASTPAEAAAQTIAATQTNNASAANRELVASDADLLQQKQMLLVIDANQENHEALLQSFATSPITIRTAHSGEEGIAMALAFLPTWIVLHMTLPNEESWAILKQCRTHPLLAGIPLYVCAPETQKAACFAAGAELYLPPQTSPRELQARLLS